MASATLWPFRAQMLPVDHAAWLSGIVIIIIIREPKLQLRQKRKLGEHGSSPALRPFRAHVCPVDRAAWLSCWNLPVITKPIF